MKICRSRIRCGLEHHVGKIFNFFLICNPVLVLKNLALFLLVEALLLGIFASTLRILEGQSVNLVSFERNVGEDDANILL